MKQMQLGYKFNKYARQDKTMKALHADSGFTLIEVLIALAMGSIIIGAALAAFFSMQTTASSVDQRSNMAVNARGAIYLIEENIRLLGFNPENDLSANNIMNPADGCCALGGFFTFNRNDLADPTNDAADATIGIGLLAADDSSGGGRDGFADGGATSLVINGGNVADDIAVLRFAYAFDDDDDGNVDMSAGDFIRWAIDSDGDGRLDRELDTNDDGEIDINDVVGGMNMVTPVDISKIRAVKVWLVTRSKYPVKGHTESRTFVVGDRRYTPNDNFSHTLLTTTVRCRNMFI
jgi:prepilin-type N-terminal cleavage/methylation domain-containing protein